MWGNISINNQELMVSKARNWSREEEGKTLLFFIVTIQGLLDFFLNDLHILLF